MRCGAPSSTTSRLNSPFDERHALPVGVGEAARVQVELPALEAVGADTVRPALAHFGAAAAQHGADAREQLARAERLGEVVVGAELEAHHAVGLFRAAGEHDDRNRRFVAQRARERHAVLGLEPEIEHHEVDHLLGEHLAHGGAVGYRGHAQIVLPEVVDDQLPDAWIVVDRQDDAAGPAWEGACGCSSWLRVTTGSVVRRRPTGRYRCNACGAGCKLHAIAHPLE